MQVATSYRTPGPLNLCNHHNKEWLPGSRTSVPSMQIKHRVCLSHSLKRLENTMTSSAKSAIASVKRSTQFLYVSRLLQPTILQCTASLLYTLRKTSVQRRWIGLQRFDILPIGSSLFHNLETTLKGHQNKPQKIWWCSSEQTWPLLSESWSILCA